MCLQLRGRFELSSSLLGGALPPVGSADSVENVNSETADVTNRMKSSTIGVVCRMPSR